MEQVTLYLPWVAVIASLGVSGTMLRISISVAKEALNKRAEIDRKIDDTKKEAEEKFVDKEVCRVLHKTLDANIEEIKKKIDSIPAIKVGVDLLLKKNGIKLE
ncbi:MAG: hypothetical protein JW800_02140 [Candidatus Omnitrophica bacterium]|nr:hypothetical protein [Candidatus Omnitrophota bacterium]